MRMAIENVWCPTQYWDNKSTDRGCMSSVHSGVIWLWGPYCRISEQGREWHHYLNQIGNTWSDPRDKRRNNSGCGKTGGLEVALAVNRQKRVFDKCFQIITYTEVILHRVCTLKSNWINVELMTNCMLRCVKAKWDNSMIQAMLPYWVGSCATISRSCLLWGFFISTALHSSAWLYLV